MASVPIVIKDPEPPKKLFNKTLLKDFYKPMTKEDIVEKWANQWSSDLIARDTMIESMKIRDISPKEWTSKRESEAGLYPNVADPDFAARLYRKTEFSDLRSTTVADDICYNKEGFDTTPVQRLVARFLHPQTPYRGVLVDHGVGVGKTCTAITVAETFLEAMPHNHVFILCPQAIQSGFRRTIFDADRLIPVPPREAQLRGEVWESYQCTGMTYPRLSGTANERNRETVENAVNYAISRRYKIMGYLAFANWVKKKMEKQIPKTLQGDAKTDAENQLLQSLFSDHLIIIDEAHNLRDDMNMRGKKEAVDLLADEDVMQAESPEQDAVVNAAEAAEARKSLTPIIQRILRVSEGLRLLTMSATPMYNTAPEILFLLNLLILNDTKDDNQLLKTRDFFSTDGTLLEKGKEPLRKVCGRYISYMRGETPASFPLRLTPPTAAGESLFVNYPRKSISRKEETVKLTNDVKKIMSMLPLVIHTPDIKKTAVGRVLHKILGTSLGDLEDDMEEGSEVSDFVLDQAMKVANITYPNGSYGSDGWDTYWNRSGGKIRQFTWNAPADEDDEDYTPSVDDVFGSKNLANYCPKIAAIVESLIKAKGMCFTFSRYVKAGALPIAVALERAGWTRVLSNGSPYPVIHPDSARPVRRQCAFCAHKEGETHEGHKFAPANFVLLTGDESITPDFRGTLRYANTLVSDFDTAGGKVKAIIGSQIASEGIDLKCIRENHLLDGWYHLNRIEQVEGRAVRYCSHAALPLEQRNCLIYLHAVSIPDYESADLYAYRLAAKKAIPIGQVQRIIKIAAWDCMMNREAILLQGLTPRRIVDAQGRETANYNLHDKPYTSICDFQERCEYACAVTEIPEKDDSTYETMDARRRFMDKQKILRRIFSNEIAYPVEFLKRTVYADMPWEIGSIGLRNVLNNPQFVIQRSDGIRGMLILRNGYVVFQPLGISEPEIPMALRFGRTYGALPRSMEFSRGAMFYTDIKAPKIEVVEEKKEKGKEKEGKVVAKPVTGGVEEAMKSLNTWKEIIQKIFTTSLVDSLAPPPRFPEAYFEGWRWVFHHFAAVPETKAIAEQWWMDTEWTISSRAAVLSHWLTNPMSEEETRLSAGFRPSEFFKSDTLSGYLTPDAATNKVLAFCMFEGDESPAKCTDYLMKDVETIIGKPVNRENDTGPYFAFLTTDSKTGTILFKTVDKSQGKRAYAGAQCANTPNLDNHLIRVKGIQHIIRNAVSESNPIHSLLLDENDETMPTAPMRKKRQETKQLEHIGDLTQKQICPYMEFLFRWMDQHRVNGKRWFLSVVENARGGGKLG